MGTPEIAREVLKAVSSEYDVVGVFCQPDKPVGRKHVITPPPVKVFAEEAGIPVYQPKGFKNGKATQILRELAPDLILVIAYGKILPQEVLDVPRLGCINVHASLLPKYRGAAPIQRAIIAGEEVTGITIMKMDAGMDTGNMLAQREIPILPEDNEETMFRKMGEVGSKFVLEILPLIEAGELEEQHQDHDAATYAPPIEKEEGEFSFREDAAKVVHLIHGVSVWPVAYFQMEDKKIKVADAAYSEKVGEPGEVLSLRPLTIAAENGSVILNKVIPEGGKPMDGNAWANGRRFRQGDNIYT